MAERLSFWNADSRRRSEGLHGGPVEGIYVPFGKDRISRGDTIYSVGIEDDELRLITRVRVGSIEDDPEDEDSVLIEDVDEGVDVDFDREVSPEVIEAIEYEQVDGSKHRMPILGVRIGHAPFQDRSSIRALSKGAADLGTVL